MKLTLLAELFQIQGHRGLVGRDELLQRANARGADVTDGQLTAFVTEGLFPYGPRAKGQKVQWPEISVDLLVLIGTYRRAHVGFEALHELIPLWCYIERARSQGSIDLTAFEREVRDGITRLSAAFWVPWLLGGLLGGPQEISVTRRGEPVEENPVITVATLVDGEEKVFGEFPISFARAVDEATTVALTVDL